jgi:large subunit ribosomal protein L5
MSSNPIRTIKIEKVILSVGGTGENLDKGFRLLKIITGRNPMKRISRKRIPALGVRPKLEVGAMITIRKDIDTILKRTLTAAGNKLRRRQIDKNNFSFGVKEYIEVPGMEYQRDIGIMGFDVTVVFKRPGYRVKLRKVKTGKVPARQSISREEIIKFMEENYKTDFVGKM